ncbi:hypothetical protein FOXYSP1_03424 [Fusarium oxysporum f. sp. phaseoli]
MFLKSFLVLVTKASRSVWSWLMSVSSAVGIHISRNIATITRLAKFSKGYSFRSVKRDPMDGLDICHILRTRLPLPNMINV